MFIYNTRVFSAEVIILPLPREVGPVGSVGDSANKRLLCHGIGLTDGDDDDDDDNDKSDYLYDSLQASYNT